MNSFRIWVAGIPLVCAACSTTQPMTFEDIQQQQVRSLTMQCVRRQEGLLEIYQPMEVVMACKTAARRRVTPSFHR